MILKTKEENRTNAQYKPLRLRVELVHLFPLVVQKLSSLIITEFTKYKSNSLSKPFIIKILLTGSMTALRRGSVTVVRWSGDGTSTILSSRFKHPLLSCV